MKLLIIFLKNEKAITYTQGTDQRVCATVNNGRYFVLNCINGQRFISTVNIHSKKYDVRVENIGPCFV